MPGVNRAQSSVFKSAEWRQLAEFSQRACVFVSYKGDDILAAREISIILQNNDIDVWFDENDLLLGIANQTDNHEEVVRRIEEAILNSTHVLAVISEKTKESWWVSFEIGSGRRKMAQVAYVALSDIVSLPAYLKIATQIKTEENFATWVNGYFDKYITKSAKLSSREFVITRLPHFLRDPIPFYNKE